MDEALLGEDSGRFSAVGVATRLATGSASGSDEDNDMIVMVGTLPFVFGADAGTVPIRRNTANKPTCRASDTRNPKVLASLTLASRQVELAATLQNFAVSPMLKERPRPDTGRNSPVDL